MNPLINVALLAITPVSELRGAISYGIISGQAAVPVFFTAVLFNILVFPIVMLFLNFFHKAFLKIGFYRKNVNKYLDRVHKRVHAKVERYGYWGLVAFVAIPLPVTGAYTGTAGAWLLGMEKKKAFLAVSAGVLIAGIIVTAAMLAGVGILGLIIK